MLQNGGFETGSNDLSNAANWVAWWEETPKPKEGYDYAYKPQWNRELLSNGAAQELVYAEDASLRIFNNWNPFHAGVYQTVAVPANTKLRLTAHARLWASQDSWPSPSDESVNARVQVGVDLFSGLDAFSSNVVWSSIITPHNRWQPVTFDFVSRFEIMTVFLSVNYRGESRQNMMAFFDGVSLQKIHNIFLPFVSRS